MSDALIESPAAAVAARPGDMAPRPHLVEPLDRDRAYLRKRLLR